MKMCTEVLKKSQMIGRHNKIVTKNELFKIIWQEEQMGQQKASSFNTLDQDKDGEMYR